MATSDLAPVGAETEHSAGIQPVTVGGTGRRLAGLVGQYTVLVVLALVVLAPLLITIRQALSPPFQWVLAGAPWHPRFVVWKDRTWWSGGLFSAVVRTLVVAFVLAWLQKTATGRGWKAFFTRPGRPALAAALVGTVALGITTSAAFESFHAADGRTTGLVIVAMVVVAVIQALGYATGPRSVATAALMGAATGFLVAGSAILFVGPEVWTQSWSQADLGGSMFRSLVMTVCITVLQVGTSIAAAYAFVFLKFPFRRTLFALFMATLLLPLEVTLLANITTIQDLDWTSTYQGLVLPFAASAIGTFLINQGFRGIPPDLQDAARLDGYGHLRFMLRVAVPLTRPVVAAFTVISALQAWNQYLWPQAVIRDNRFNTLQIQLSQVAAGDPARGNLAVAAALVAAVPVVLVLLAFQRQIVRGLTAGAVK